MSVVSQLLTAFQEAGYSSDPASFRRRMDSLGNDNKLLWLAGGVAIGAILFTQQGRQIAQTILAPHSELIKSLLPATELAKKETSNASSPQG